MSRRLLLTAVLALGACTDGGPQTVDLAARIRFHEAQIERHPRHYPAHALLGEAWLQRARSTHDPADLQRAEAALRQSLAIQENFEALRGMAGLACFRHRFADGLAWVQRAAECAPSDPVVRALLVEARIGLGDAAAAGSALADATGYYAEVARARLATERGADDEAVARLRAATDLAERSGAPALAVWALVRAAGIRLDGGDAAAARPLLEAAAAVDPDDRALQEHLAELDSAEGRPAAALARYERLLAAQPDPTVHAAAAAAARAAGDSSRAEFHFAAARVRLEAALAAGEVFPLGALARLFADAGVELDRARELARRNLEFVKDRDAHATLRAIQAGTAGAR